MVRKLMCTVHAYELHVCYACVDHHKRTHNCKSKSFATGTLHRLLETSKVLRCKVCASVSSHLVGSDNVYSESNNHLNINDTFLI